MNNNKYYITNQRNKHVKLQTFRKIQQSKNSEKRTEQNVTAQTNKRTAAPPTAQTHKQHKQTQTEHIPASGVRRHELG